MLEQPLAFTTATLLALIRRRGGEPHVTLAAEPVWYDETAQRVLDAQVNAVLAERGLFGPGGFDFGTHVFGGRYAFFSFYIDENEIVRA